MSSHPNSPNPPTSGPPAAGQSRPPIRPPGTRLMVWVLLLSLVGSWGFLEGPREVARWYVAGAKEEREAGRNELAYARLERALTWSANEPVILLQRCQWRTLDGEYETALKDCERAAELVGENHAQILLLRSQLYQHLKRFDK